jgi:predicted nuclease of predicted toxin-antitoxin system
MRLYLDEDLSSPRLAQLLRNAGHDVQTPDDVGMRGESDAAQFACGVRGARVCLTRDYGDWEDLHALVLAVQGHHPGILVVRRDNDPRRNLKPHEIVRAIHNIEAANDDLTDQYEVLNHWR